MQKQLLLPLKYISPYSEHNFVVSGCNKTVFDWLQIWPYNNSNNFTCIVGERGSGKTHLAHIWSNMNGAVWFPSDGFNFDRFCSIAIDSGLNCFVIDDIDNMIEDILLFHLYNFIKNRRCYLLSTASSKPKDWSVKLSDTISRLATIHVESIGSPVNEMEGVVSQVLINRGISPSKNIITYIANNIERSYTSINTFANIVDERLPEYKRFCLDFVKDIVEEMISL